MNPAEVLSRIVCTVGLPRLTRATVGRRRAAILLYHDPSPEVVDAHLTHLRRHHALVSLDEVVEHLRARTFDRLPERAVAITIDDGHRGNRDLLDVFRRHDVVPTIYLCSQIVGTDRHYWFLDTPDPEPLKKVPNGERLRLLADTGFDQAASHDPESRQALTLDEVREMADGTSFGGHTRFHPILPMCDSDEAEAEIAGCRGEIEEWLDRPCLHFAYPNGDHSPREVDMVRRAGYRSGRTTATGWVGPRSDPYRLPILGVPDDASITRLEADLTGVTSWLAHHWGGGLPRPWRRG